MKKVGHGPNRNRQPEDRIVGWGKHAGKRMSEVPTNYLQWFVKNAFPHMVARKAWAQEELNRRKNKQGETS